MPWSRAHRMAYLLFLTMGGIALLVPYLSADGFEQQLRADLEALLQRPVEVQEVRFTLWGGPGFLLRNVVIADHPEISAEPFAYVSEVRLRVGLSTLWKWHPVYSRITLSQPSLNLAQGADGRWNYLQMMPSTLADTLESGHTLPTLRVEGGRINFRQGLRKSVYYLRNADLQLAEEGIGADSWIVEFRAEPARTDSYAPRFGTIRGRGRWRAGAGPNGELDMDVEIERSPLAELTALLGLSRVGLSGYVRGRAHVSGPVASLSLRGNLELRELMDWSLFSTPESDRGVALEGTVDLPGRSLRLRTAARGPQPLPYEASLDLSPPTDPGSWQAAVRFDELPVQSLFGVAQYLDDTIPRYPALSGSVGGELVYHSQRGLRGALTGDQLLWDGGEGPLFALRQLQLRLEGQEVEAAALLGASVPPAPDPVPMPASPSDSSIPGKVVALPPAPEAPASGDEVAWKLGFDRGTGQLTSQLTGTLTRRHLDAQGLLAPAVTALPSLLDGGNWTARGVLDWRRAHYRATGTWQGQLETRGLESTLPLFAAPVRFQSGSLEVRGKAWRLQNTRGMLGNIPFRADFAYSPSAAQPLSGEFRAEELDLETLDALLVLAPPGRGGFLRRALRRSPPADGESVAGFRAHAKFYIESVLIENSKYTGFRGDLFWNGENVNFRNISFQSRFGSFRGIAEVNLNGGNPEWAASLSSQHTGWDEGVLRMELQRFARGGFGALFRQPRGEAQVSWTKLGDMESSPSKVLRAELRWEDGIAQPSICEQCVELRDAHGVWLGSCNQSNGTGYVCLLEDPRTRQQVQLELPISMVGSEAK